MLIKKIIIDSYRNIENIELNFSNNNLIYGNNGAGKTTILDSIYQIAYGKSFQSNQNKHLIKNNKDCFTLFADINNVQNISKVAISKNLKGKKTSKVNGKLIKKQSDISLKLPVISILSESLKSLNGTSNDIRAFINLCMFHVEPLFLNDWKKYNLLLKQRNIALRAKSFDTLSIWDNQLSNLSTNLSNQISNLLTKLEIQLNIYTKKILDIDGFKIDFNQGWVTDITLKESLNKNLEKDIKYGYTTSGIHRYKIKYINSGSEIKNYFSAGQSKLFIYCLYLALIAILDTSDLLVLIDDPLSELDKDNCDRIFTLLEDLNIQKVITTSVLPEELQNTFKVFHVEHGSLISEN